MVYQNSLSVRWYFEGPCLESVKTSLYPTQKAEKIETLQFSIGIVERLTRARDPIRITERPSKRQSNESTPPTKRKNSIPLPASVIRYDDVHHWPDFCKKKLNCGLCKTGNSQVYCKKCSICPCLSNTRNCFYDFHINK